MGQTWLTVLPRDPAGRRLVLGRQPGAPFPHYSLCGSGSTATQTIATPFIATAIRIGSV